MKLSDSGEANKTYDRLTTIKKVGSDNWGGAYWLFSCSCGNEHITRLSNVKQGRIKSCGCLYTKLKQKHPLQYDVWQKMKQRCSNPKNESYHNYGGRGISVCKEWQDSFEQFLKDMGETPEGLTIERINNDGNYEPDNCTWATRKEQANNTRRTKEALTINGVILKIKES